MSLHVILFQRAFLHHVSCFGALCSWALAPFLLDHPAQRALDSRNPDASSMLQTPPRDNHMIRTMSIYLAQKIFHKSFGL